MVSSFRIPALFCLLAAAPSAAFATCFDYCSQLCQQNPGDLDHQTCTSRCTTACVEDAAGHYSFTNGAPVSVTAALSKHAGAIALSESTLSSGRSFGYPTTEQAQAQALQHCHEDTPGKPADCKVILTFTDACAALATLPKPGGGGFWGTAFAPEETDAGQKALASCKVMANADCTVAASFCSK